MVILSIIIILLNNAKNVFFYLRYVLLKEKNMLLTMEQACKDESEYFPNPERIDKVSRYILYQNLLY
jgi:hypothetical protein